VRARVKLSSDVPLCMMQPSPLVSIHGGHSGEFCPHARDTLKEIIERYIEKGFAWIGLTEHAPPPDSRFLFPHEVAAGWTLERLQKQLHAYMNSAREFQKAYAEKIAIMVGLEVEGSPDCLEYSQHLIDTYRPDYFLGSIHDIEGKCFESSREFYWELAEHYGGWKALYTRYFDTQCAMIEKLRPLVVSHFDLIRMFDPDYSAHLQDADIWQKIERNLQCVKDFDLILDYNVSALRKGASEPYVSAPILRRARELDIRVIPGDDSHGVATVGVGIPEGIANLAQAGFDTSFPLPKFPRYGG